MAHHQYKFSAYKILFGSCTSYKAIFRACTGVVVGLSTFDVFYDIDYGCILIPDGSICARLRKVDKDILRHQKERVEVVLAPLVK